MALAAVLVALAPGVAQAQAMTADGLGAFSSRAELDAFILAHRPPPPEEVEISGREPGPRGPIPDLQAGGVDEAGEVQRIGRHLVIVRRGRLHTVSVAENAPRVVDSIVVAPTEAQGFRFDRMLVFRDQVIVFGEAYDEVGRSELVSIARFRVGPDGRLARRDVHHLALEHADLPRLIEGRLVFVSQSRDEGFGAPPGLPAMRSWVEGAPDAAFESILHPRDAFIRTSLRRRADRPINWRLVVTRCDLTTPDLRCRSTLVLSTAGAGPADLSEQAAYLWTMGGSDADPVLYRIPLDYDQPRAVGVRGHLVGDLRIDERAGVLQAVVESRGYEDEAWDPRFGDAAVAVLTLPFSRFGSGSGEAPVRGYRFLPGFPQDGRRFVRLIGDHVLYGANDGAGGWNKGPGLLLVADARGGRETRFEFDGPITRLDSVGENALIVSGREAAAFTTLSLGRESAVIDRFAGPPDAEVEAWTLIQRAPDRDRSALLGVALARPIPDDGSDEEVFGDLLLLRRDRGRLSAVGELASRRDLPHGPECDDWCDGWFANSRAVFLEDRIFALLGGELVEGRVEGGGIREVARVTFAPAPPSAPEKGQDGSAD